MIMDFVIRLLVVDLLENSFIILLALLFMKKHINFKKTIPTIAVVTLISQFLYINDDAFIVDRLILFASMCIFLVIFKNIKLNEVFKLIKSIFLAMGVMVIIQSIALLPFILFLELDMTLVRTDIIKLAALSVPTRLMEWSALYLYYLKRGVKK